MKLKTWVRLVSIILGHVVTVTYVTSSTIGRGRHHENQDNRFKKNGTTTWTISFMLAQTYVTYSYQSIRRLSLNDEIDEKVHYQHNQDVVHLPRWFRSQMDVILQMTFSYLFPWTKIIVSLIQMSLVFVSKIQFLSTGARIDSDDDLVSNSCKPSSEPIMP